jgi:Helix-turn-helix
MATDKLFDCVECLGPVQLVAKPGRMHLYRRGHCLPVPDDFVAKTCARCGEMYLDDDETERLDLLLAPVFLKQQSKYVRSLVDNLREKHGVSLRDIERACGVTNTYLSHVIGGKRETSTTLIRLIEAFVRNPQEFRLYLGKSVALVQEHRSATVAMFKAPMPKTGQVRVDPRSGVYKKPRNLVLVLDDAGSGQAA